MTGEDPQFAPAGPPPSATAQAPGRSTRTPSFSATADTATPSTRNRSQSRFHTPRGLSPQLGPTPQIATCGARPVVRPLRHRDHRPGVARSHECREGATSIYRADPETRKLRKQVSACCAAQTCNARQACPQRSADASPQVPELRSARDPRLAGRCSRRQKCSSLNESGALPVLLDPAGWSSPIARRKVA